jgi:hypothetical protein
LHFRPGLELLEDRFAPAATITVNSALDNDVRDNPLTLREAILVNNRTLAVASLTAAEKVQVAGSPSDGDADTIAFAIPAGDVGDPGDPDDGHVYYRDDGGGVSNDRVTRGNVTITTAASDLAIADIDPDHPHSWFSLQPTTTLPALTDAVILDGFSQPGASANTKAVGNDAVYRIEINGQRVTSGSEIGLTLSALASTLRGIVINGWHHGVAMSTDSHLEGAFVGADVSGTVAVGNVDVGVLVPNLPRANIGGPAPAQRNLISGNQTGIGISGPYEANASVVVNNYIGTNAAGTASLGNRNNGVEINDGHGNRIGGTTAAERNLISGNLQNGVIIYNGHGTFFSATGNIIIGNYIGTNATGDGAVPNLHAGVAILAGTSQFNVVGRSEPGAGNVISGNGGEGVTVGSRNSIRGNLIGTQADGVHPLGNTRNGVAVGSDLYVGGPASADGNTIAFNGDDGIFIGGSTGVRALNNRIFGNGSLGIDMLGNGPTPNGPLNPQNFPIVSAVTATAANTTIQGTLNSDPAARFLLQFFASDLADPSGYGEGQRFLGEITTDATDAAGDVSFTAVLPITLSSQLHHVTATATRLDAAGAPLETSEFSQVLPADGPPPQQTPVADHDSYAFGEGETLNVAAPGVLDGDTDVNGDALTARLVSGPDHAASFVLNADGSFLYVHDGSEIERDSFTYRATDGHTESEAIVTLEIDPRNDPPTISSLADQTTTRNTPTAPQTFTVTDVDSLLPVITLTSSNQALIPDDKIILSEAGAGLAIRVFPLADRVGTATIFVTVNDGFASTTASFQVTVLDDEPPGSSIQGQVFDDRDGDGERDAGEEGLNGWTIELVDPETRQVVATQETSTRFGVPGSYRFGDVAPDTYLVREVPQRGWHPTAPRGEFGFDRRSLGEPFGPSSVAAADLDGDGDMDLAMGEGTTDSVMVFLNTGDGSFDQATRFPTGGNTVFVAAGDLDGDGDVDLVVANRTFTPNSTTDHVAVLLNDGAGSFGPATSFQAGVGPTSVGVGDLDSDGDLDLVVANQISGGVSLLLNRGDGHFRTKTLDSNAAHWVVVASRDGDLDLDVVIANQNGITEAFPGPQQGADPIFIATSLATSHPPGFMTSADLDGDGRPDLAVTSRDSGHVSVFLTSGRSEELDVGLHNVPLSLTAADLDGDGDVDLAVGTFPTDAGVVSVWLNRGNGSFHLAASVPIDITPWSLAAADLDGDGDADLAVADGLAGVVLFNRRVGPHVVDLGPSQAVAGLDFGNVERAQIVSGTGPSVSVIEEGLVDVTVQYTTSDVDLSLPGLGLRMHYDSSKLALQQPLIQLRDRHLIASQDLADQLDFDGDASTDRFLLLGWRDVAGNWPGPNLPLPLFTTQFRPTAAAAGTASTIRFSAVSTAPTHGFRGDPITVGVLQASLDIDGNGTADALTDGLLMRRYLGGMRGVNLVQDAVALDATRTSATEITEYLRQLEHQGVLNPDDSGTRLIGLGVPLKLDLFATDRMADGELIERYLLGVRGNQLTAGGFGPDATRTNAAAIVKFLDQFLPDRALVSGKVFEDANGNGLRDSNERSIENLAIFVDANNNGTFDSTDPSTLSRADGTYKLRFPPGTYVLRAQQFAHLQSTTALGATRFVTLTASGQHITGQDFGLKMIEGGANPAMLPVALLVLYPDRIGVYSINQSGDGSIPGGNVGGTVGGGLSIQPGQTLQGSGTMPGSVSSRGRVSPGQSPGVLTIDGDYTQEATGELLIEIGGLTPGTQYDQLHVTGAAALGGSLTVALVNGFMPRPGDRFQVTTYGSRTGVFETLNGLNLGGGLVLTPVYEADGVTLVAQRSGPAVLSARPIVKNGVLVAVVLRFSEPLAPASARNPANYRLLVGGVRRAVSASYDPQRRSVRLTFAPFRSQAFGLTLRGRRPGGLTDRAGNLLDGDRNDQPGGAFVMLVERPAATSRRVTRG